LSLSQALPSAAVSLDLHSDIVLRDDLVHLPEKISPINSLPDDIKLIIMEFLAPVITPQNLRSEMIAQAFYALSIVLQRFQLSVVFGPVTFQHIFSAYHLQQKLIYRLSLSDYECRFLGNLSFSILYKKNDESPEKIINEFDEVHKFMDEQGRQSVLEHFVNVYPEWLPENQQEFIDNFRHICKHIETVELARRYYNVLGEDSKKFFGFAMLQMPFNAEEVTSFITADAYQFFKFPQTPKSTIERTAAWTINQTLIAGPSLTNHQRDILSLVNDIELSDAEAIHGIGIEVLCKLLSIFENGIQLCKWINLIWSKLKVADADGLVASSPIPLDEMPFSARVALAPHSVFQFTNHTLNSYVLGKIIYDLSNFSSSDMGDVFEQHLRSFIKADFLPHDPDHHKVLLASLHFYSVKADSEMIQILTAYFLQDLSCLKDHLWRLPAYSPIWAGRLCAEYVNFISDSSAQSLISVLHWAIASALFRNDEAFLRQLNVPASKIITIAHECGAVPQYYSKEQLETILPDNRQDTQLLTL